jgi:hypothetical protein
MRGCVDLPGDGDLCHDQHLRFDGDLPRYPLVRWDYDLSGYVNLRRSSVMSWDGYLYRGCELRRKHHLRAEPDMQRHRSDLLQ